MRFRLGLVAAAVALAGCGDESTFSTTGPLTYARNEALAEQLQETPRLQAGVDRTLAELFGPGPRDLHIPPGLDLPGGGLYLANHFRVVGDDGTPGPREVPKYHNSLTGRDQLLEGGYALYRRHCLHCHGVSGDGNGPTAPFLWPAPRDYRPGIFKFTSTTGGAKPTRDDLRRIVRKGIPRTSMPSFEALMTPQQIEQVLDYVIFLSARGQVEQGLTLMATTVPEEEADSFFADPYNIEAVTQGIFDQWAQADSQVLDPPAPRTEPTRESLLRGRELFLGRTPEKLECAGCHGNRAHGDGPSFVPPDITYDVVFRGVPIESFDEATQKLWETGSLDEWGKPLRPADLNAGPDTTYKGGRRPLDIYWRIAKGINGAKMPAHESALKPEQIWDLVNFVLALPYQPELLENVPAAPAAPAESAAVARR